MPRPPTRRAPAECPVCGEDVPPRATACPHCGADDRTGWNDDATRYDGLDLPDSAFADDEETATPRRPLRRGPHPLWLIVGVLLLLWLVLLALSPGHAWF